MENYFEIKFSFNENNKEEIYNYLYTQNVGSILEEENNLIIYIEYEKKSLFELVEKEVTEKFPGTLIQNNKFEDKNWNDEWEKNIEPVYIKNRIVIFPSWKRGAISNKQDLIKIEIDPKMSFGTGHNETTQLVLELMCEHIDENDKNMLDYGSGTGVLSIAGINLGIEKAVAIDIDEDAILNAEEYFTINNVSDKILMYQKNIDKIEEKDFDVITANIIRTVIENNIKSISEKTKHNGKIFVSGVLINETERILEVLSGNGFTVKEILKKAEWLGIYAIKN